eukprot:CAMPEP_0114670422 /NCGR_PEP_ID=MMETSP0191-20121206/39497_1 /TAXON_ID=126664 /ORGANISM="Sorites sp." /LENGTH=185 /DNA_ID=CAMNT_0001927959 /DNA_START=383 /DNA_END=941 /DNA_ORIENTATION=+
MPYETKTTKQNPKKLDGKGGKLILRGTDIILFPGAKITVRGCGYKGGHGKGLTGDVGQGPGGGEVGWGDSAKGGKYGGVYGNERLDKLWLGSGGGAYNGSGHTIRPGGSGGGILDIECVRLWLKSDSKIIASGKNSANAGGGSGGSIYIKCFKLNLDGNSKIINVGGKGEGDPIQKERKMVDMEE